MLKKDSTHRLTNSLDYTSKDCLLSRGLPIVGICMKSFPMTLGGVEVIGHKRFTSSLVLGTTIRKEIWGLLLLMTHLSCVLLLQRLFSHSFLGRTHNIRVKTEMLCLPWMFIGIISITTYVIFKQLDLPYIV